MLSSSTGGRAATDESALKSTGEAVLGWGRSAYESLSHFAASPSESDDDGQTVKRLLEQWVGEDSGADKGGNEYISPKNERDFFEKRWARRRREASTAEIVGVGNKSPSSNVFKALQGLKDPSDLGQALSLLGTRKRIIWLNPSTHTSIPTSDAAMKALTIGGKGKEQSLVEKLGPLVLAFDNRLYLDKQERPAFWFDLRSIYGSKASLNDGAISNAIQTEGKRVIEPGGMPASISKFFGDNQDVLDALLEGYSDSQGPEGKSRLQKLLAGHVGIAPKVRRALYSGVHGTRLEAFLLHQVLLLSNEEVKLLTGQKPNSINNAVRTTISHLNESIAGEFPQDKPDVLLEPIEPTDPIQASKKDTQSKMEAEEKQALMNLVGVGSANKPFATLQEAHSALDAGKEWMKATKTTLSKADLGRLKNAKQISIFSDLAGKDGAVRQFSFTGATAQRRSGPTPNSVQQPTMMDGLLQFIRLKHGAMWNTNSQNMVELYSHIRGLGPVMQFDGHWLRIHDAFEGMFARWDDNRRDHADFELLRKAVGMNPHAMYSLRKKIVLAAIREGRHSLLQQAFTPGR